MVDSGRDRPAGCTSFAGDVQLGAGIGAGGVVRCRAALQGGASRARWRIGYGRGRPDRGVAPDGAHVAGPLSGRRPGRAVDGPIGPDSCPHQSPVEVETAVCEMRREHPRWGPRRLAHELGRVGMSPVPSASTVYRILVRHGLIEARKRGRRREDYKRWERDAPMALWQLDIVGGVFLADGTEVKVVTGVDDHSRYCVIAHACAAGHRPGRVPGLRRGARALRRPRGGPHGQRQTVHRPVRSGRRGALRSDLPGQRHRAPAHPTRHTDHDRQDRTLPPDPAP